MWNEYSNFTQLDAEIVFEIWERFKELLRKYPTQLDAEIIFETWERFKELLIKYPYNGIKHWIQLTNFVDGLMLAS